MSVIHTVQDTHFDTHLAYIRSDELMSSEFLSSQIPTRHTLKKNPNKQIQTLKEQFSMGNTKET